ncbi:MAG: CoA transferase, partial [Alphaproteobacteria bacterium]
ACCKALGAPDMATRPEFSTNESRLANCAGLDAELAALFAARERVEVAQALGTAGVPAAPVLSIPEIFDFPGLAENGTVIESPAGLRSIGAPARLSRTPPRFWRESPAFAEHLTEVLAATGYDETDIAGLIEREVVFSEQRDTPPTPAAKLDANARAARIPADAPPIPAPETAGALAGLKVVDLTHHVAGPWCTQVLGDHGAEIIKVEPPAGDPTRRYGPRGANGETASFLGVNRNKRSVVLNLSEESGRQELLGLLEDADVLVENFTPGTLEKWGLGYDEVLASRFPRLVYCRISAFAADGPLGGVPGHDATAQAMSGIMSVNGAPDDPPMRSGSFAASISAGLTAVGGILAALIERRRSGHGQAVDVSLFHAMLSIIYPIVPDWLLAAKTPVRRGNTHPNLAPHDVYRTEDGYVFTSLVNPRQFADFCREIGAPEIVEDERFATNEARLANVEALRAAIETALASKSSLTVAEDLLGKSVPVGAVLAVDDVLDHPQIRHREMVLDEDGYRGLGFPIKMSRTPARLRRHPPVLGADNSAVTGAGARDA